MIKIVDNDIMRGGEKIGWIEGNDIRSRDGRKVGYFEENVVRDADGEKAAYIVGGHLFAQGGELKISLETVNKEIAGGVLSEIGRCAIYVLLGS